MGKCVSEIRIHHHYVFCNPPPFPSGDIIFECESPNLQETYHLGFPDSSAGNESACNAGDPSSIPGSISWRRNRLSIQVFLGFPSSSDDKESVCDAGDLSSIPGFGRSPGGGHGNPLQDACLENPQGQRSQVGYSPLGHKELDMTGQLITAQKILREENSIMWSTLNLEINKVLKITCN